MDETLLKQYKILGKFNLDELNYLPSSSLFKFLKPLKQDKFDDAERIVFYNFHPLTQTVVSHLQNTLSYLDIPNFFIIIVTNQTSTKELLNQFHCITHDISPVFNDTGMCAHAWSGIHLWTDGSASVCCDSVQKISKPTGELYNIASDSFDDIFNSAWMTDLRQHFRDNKPHKNCHSCVYRESIGLESRRSISPYKLNNIYGLIDWESEGNLMYLGGHLGNICNLKCRICSSEFSTSIAAEELGRLPVADKKRSEHYQRTIDARWAISDTFWTQVKEHAVHIKNYEFLGGEPFLLAQNTEFLEYLIANDLSKEVNFYFSTNGTQYPQILEQVANFRKVELTISIDNIGDKFEYERYGAKWHEVEQNLTKFIQLKKKTQNVKIDVCLTISIHNVLYLPEIISWIQTHEIDSYYLNYIERPDYMSIRKLTVAAKQLIKDKFADSFPEIIKLIDDSPGSDGHDFCNETNRLDSLRGQNFSVTHPEIAKVMGYEKIT